jgi:hypothetical protein
MRFISHRRLSWASLPVLGVLALGCDVGSIERPEVLFAETGGTTYAIHVGGVCSQTFTEGRGESGLGNWPGVVSIDAQVDQRDNMAQATADMTRTLDTYCTGDDWCYIFTFSNGGATISRALSLADKQYNILWVMSAASNEGGSEIGGTGWIGETFGGCTLTGHIGTGDHRSGWNHNDTNGASFYMVGGYKCMAPYLQCGVLPGEDDGAVAFHSSGGMNDTFSSNTLCVAESAYYANHQPAFSCDGFYKNHFEMKSEGIIQTGGR